jgi:FkbH-like protein
MLAAINEVTTVLWTGAKESIGESTMIEFTPDDRYLTPNDLMSEPTILRRVLLVGACVTNGWKWVAEESQTCAGCDHILFNNAAELPEEPPFPISDYDFQITALPLRALMPEGSYFKLSYGDVAGYEKLLQDSEGRLRLLLDATMRWNKRHGLATFVANFFMPQQNAVGRLFPRYDLRNPVHFVERLNFRLAAELEHYSNAYLLDVDQISASLGRRYIQDDALCVASHNALLCDYDWAKDQNRLEKPPKPASQIYKIKTGNFIRSAWQQVLADYRILRQENSVKLVITDLDDTLWRGVIGDAEAIAGNEMEGWPIGYAEALAYLKKRGIILAIVSKNEESVIRKVWPKLLWNRMSLEDFAFVRINWKAKVENISEIIATANLLPKNVVFIDDNPVERESVKAAFPGIRVLGNDPYTLKRVLLWSSETQVRSITDESSRRTALMKAQALREEERKVMTREEFLKSLAVRVRLKAVTSASDPHFARIFELLNKTNQFNTTGKRWAQAELLQTMSSGSRLIAFFVEDKFSDYGLVGIVLISGSHIVQYVMSCRVLGMEVEIAALALVTTDMLRAKNDVITADLVETEANFPVRDLYKRAGFTTEGGRWRKPAHDEIRFPTHVDAKWLDGHRAAADEAGAHGAAAKVPVGEKAAVS